MTTLYRFTRVLIVLGFCVSILAGCGDDSARELSEPSVGGRAPTVDPVDRYLRRLIRERKGEWGGTFEESYAPATLYVLKDASRDPNFVYNGIVRWRLGLDELPKRKQKILLGLTGYSPNDRLPNTPETLGRFVAENVDLVMSDRELLFPDQQMGESVGRGFVVLGEAASGKSTLLEYLELEAARRALGDRTEPIPVLIDLPSFDKASQGRDLLDIAHTRLENAGIDLSVLGEGTSDRGILLLLDAFDEVQSPFVVSNALSQLKDLGEVDRVIVTSRFASYSQLFGTNADLRNSGYRLAILYGQSTAAIEKRTTRLESPEQRQRVIELLADNTSRGVWQQVFRLPTHFEFVVQYLIDSDDGLDSSDLTRARLLRRFVEDRYENQFEGEEQMVGLADVELLLANVAADAYLHGEGDSKIRFDRDEVYRIRGAESDSEREEIDALLVAAAKLSVVEDKSTKADESAGTPAIVRYRFSHKQWQEFYAAQWPGMWSRTEEHDFTDPRLHDIVLFKMDLGPPDELPVILDDLVRQADRIDAEGPPARSASMLGLAISAIEASGTPDRELQEWSEGARARQTAALNIRPPLPAAIPPRARREDPSDPSPASTNTRTVTTPRPVARPTPRRNPGRGPRGKAGKRTKAKRRKGKAKRP